MEKVTTMKMDEPIDFNREMLLKIKPFNPKQRLNLLKHIKKIRPDIKVVIVSGYKSVETAAEASRIGADDYITKPFEKENVLAIIERIVQ